METTVTHIITTWKTSLQRLLAFYETHRGDLKTFYPTLFMFFITLNMGCYWWALLTAFPQYLHGAAAWHYFKVSLPVGLLGAVFDSLSFFVTIYIIRRAIKSRNTLEYISHLSIDLIIAIIATFWVLFVFIISGWLIQTLTPAPPQPPGRQVCGWAGVQWVGGWVGCRSKQLMKIKDM